MYEPTWYGAYQKLADETDWLETKVGGQGIDAGHTPVCQNCREPMRQLVQLRLDQPLRLSARYQLLQVFACPSLLLGKETEPECETWAPGSGANAVVLSPLPAEVELTDGFGYPAHKVKWKVGPEPPYSNDDITLSPREEALREKILISQNTDIKLGGLPEWIQSEEWPDCPECGGPTRFVFSFDSGLTEGPDGYTTWMEHVVRDGYGYVFLCENECSPFSGAFLVQST